MHCPVCEWYLKIMSVHLYIDIPVFLDFFLLDMDMRLMVSHLHMWFWSFLNFSHSPFHVLHPCPVLLYQ